ncbi:hypothetical protein Tco_0455430, partial [Tanacetum coccineum]
WWCDEGDGVAWMVMMLLVGMMMVRWCGDDGDDDGVEMVVVRGVMGWSEVAGTAPEI